MTVKDWLKESTDKLNEADITTARLDCLVLLEDELKQDRAWLLSHDSTIIPSRAVTKLNNLLNKRIKHLPLAYIRGTTEFYGRNFVITPAVLEPRPESETMIDLLKDISPSGLLEFKGASVSALDIDEDALKVAKTNVDLFTLNINIFKSDLLSNVAEAHDILLCNLPYVPDDFKINLAALHEPKIAIYGGSDGLDLYRKLFNQINDIKFKPLYILTESLPTQHQELKVIAEASSYKDLKKDDFIQVFQLTIEQ
jgi:release factor glutamine methyltransferase